MNTNPAEERLTLWLDDEMPGDESASFETVLEPERFAERDEVRRIKSLLAANLSAAEEPPYAEFFNSRVLAEIGKTNAAPPLAREEPWWMPIRRLMMPLGVCAGMSAAFLLGARSQSGGDARQVAEIDVSQAPRAIPVESFVYTPDQAVEAEWYDSKEASAVVLVLNGIDAIPDQIDLSETAMRSDDEDREMADTGPGGEL